MINAHLRILLPSDLASEAVDEGIGERDVRVRGVSEIVRLIVEGVNTGASVVTVLVAVHSINKLVASILFRCKGEQVRLSSSDRLGRETASIVVQANDPRAADRISEFLFEHMPTQAPSQDEPSDRHSS